MKKVILALAKHQNRLAEIDVELEVVLGLPH